MKKALFLLLIFITLYCTGQTPSYIPFPTSNGNWVYRYYTDMGVPTFNQTQYALSGDTIISSSTYKKCFAQLNYKGGVREYDKVIYFVPDTTSNEYVLYDFNLGLGDTIIHPFGGAICSNDTVSVIQVDSILASDGYHRQLWLSSFAVWIEGIGSTNYLLEPAQNFCISGNYRIECMTSDTSFLYPSLTSSCALSLSKAYELDRNLSIFPNPSAGFFTIALENSTIKEFFISDLLGNKIQCQQVNNQTTIKIDNLRAGTYFVTLVDINNNTHKAKIISCP